MMNGLKQIVVRQGKLARSGSSQYIFGPYLQTTRGGGTPSVWLRASATFILATAILGMASCSTKSSALQTPVASVAITQAPPSSLLTGNSAQVSAMVSNDSANAGVDWIATCASAPNCGAFFPTHTASGGTTTYTAPTGVPTQGTVAVTALSTTDHSKFTADNVTILTTVTGVAITQPPAPSVPAGTIITIAAAVAGDPYNLGVNWTGVCVTPAGQVSCTPKGGLLQPAGGTVLFSVPQLAGNPLTPVTSIVLTASATADHSFSATVQFSVTAPITISITQAPPSTLLTSGTASVIAVTQNDITNSGITWQVSCIAQPCGTIQPTQSASGAAVLFTAPPTVPATNPVVTITAYATAAGLNVSASANVTIAAPISVQLTEEVTSSTIVINQNANLMATVANDTANAGVDWSVTCGSPGACGSFLPAHTASGAPTVYTAPAAVPTGSTVLITAASTTDPTKTATQTVTVTLSVPPNSLLLGNSVILLTAKNSVNGPFVVGGVITGDGNGNITAGYLDLVDTAGNASSGVNLSSTAPSTYSIGTDGRGQIHLVINTNVLNTGFGEGRSGAIDVSVAFVTPQHALLSETDNFGAANGTLDQQDLSSFTVLSGAYSLKLTGVDMSKSNAPYIVASAVTIPSASSYSYITDQSDGGAITSVPATTLSEGFYTNGVYQNGRLNLPSVDLGLQTQFGLDLWVIDGNHFVVVDLANALTTAPFFLSGYFTAQPSAPSVSGTFAFTEAGQTTAAQPQVAGGIFTCGSTGTLDVAPLSGAGLSNQAINVACSTPTNGRGLITISGAATAGMSQFAAYPTTDQGLYLIELDGGATGTSGPSGAGVAMQQTIVQPINSSALNGAYASNFVASTTLGTEVFAGQVVSDGVSALSGTADVNSFNATATPPVGTPSSGATLSGSYTAANNGRFPLMLTVMPAAGQPTPEITTFQPICYIVSANSCLLLGSDSTAPGTGVLQFQNTGLQ